MSTEGNNEWKPAHQEEYEQYVEKVVAEVTDPEGGQNEKERGVASAPTTALANAFAEAKQLKPRAPRGKKVREQAPQVPTEEKKAEEFIQVETKPGLAWEEPKEAPPVGRAPRPAAKIEEGPFVQVETKIPVGEATELSLPVLDTVVGREAGIQESSFESIRALLAQELEEEGKLEKLTLTRVPDGLQLHAELDAGLLDGRAVVDGMITNGPKWIHIDDGLEVKGRERMKVKVKNALLFFEDAVQDHFEKQYAGAVSGISLGETNLQINLSGGEAAQSPVEGVAGSSEPTESTPKEWREKLRTLIAGAKEKIGGGERSAFLEKRSEDLDREAATLGMTEKKFRELGEWYNKYGWKTKLAVGASLGIGAGIFATASMPLAIACLSGIAAQRTAGLASSFLKFEKQAKDTAWGKEKAMGKAIAYTATMTGAMLLLTEGVKEGVSYAQEHDWGGATHEWLKQHWPFGNGAKPMNRIATGVVTSEVPDVSTIDIPATPGHGAEYMMKQLWEQMQSKHITLPSGTDPHSDLARLLQAKPDEIDKVVHMIATDPKHGFFNPDGTSVQVNLNSHLTIGTDGQIRLDGHLRAPEHTPTASHALSESSGIRETVTPSDFVPQPPFTSLDAPVPTPSAMPLEQHIPVPESSSIPDSTLSAPHHETGYLEDSSGHSVVDSQGHPIHIGSAEVASNINVFGIPVPPTEPHLYLGEGKTLFVYGGSLEERAKLVGDYLAHNPGKIVYGEGADAHRVTWIRDLAGKVVQGPPVRAKGLSGLFSPFMRAPNPDEFRVQIK